MRWKLIIGVIFLALVFASACLDPEPDPMAQNGQVKIEIKNTSVVLEFTIKGGSKLRISLYINDPDKSHQHQAESCGQNKTCIRSGDEIHTMIDTTTGIIKVSRSINNPRAEIIDCIELKTGVEWFGGPQMRYQHWPIQHMYYEEEPYVPTHPTNMAVTERYWLSSEGSYIFVEDTDPLFLDQNNFKDKHLCLIAKNKNPYTTRAKVTLNYEVGTMIANPRKAHELAIKNHLGKPSGIPDERMIRHPIWSTWARYKVNVSDKIVREFAQEILSNGFNNSQLEIDDNWETCYGSAIFDSEKFPNVTKLTGDLKKQGFRTTLWIHPFINEDCSAYEDAFNEGYFVRNSNNSVSMSWWQGQKAATIDFTNPSAVSWWVARLKKLEDQGIDSFKFDAGEVSWLPQPPILTGDDQLKPGIFTTKYVTALAENFDSFIEARVGWRSQNLPIFIRMIDKDSRWTWNNGLPTLITTLLQMNLNGYVFVLPDMIGGNGYVNNSLNSTELPGKELFIRWLQANVFMPSLQYSFVPWDYDNEVIIISKNMTDLHAEVTPRIVKAMKKAVETGAPVNPPIWWVDPTNKEAHKINDQYLLGEEVLVAPVIERGAISRDIYLPSGIWRDGNTYQKFAGPKWIRNYPAPLAVLPHFYKL
ncbi:myogenesis-regulating glycosidase [Belonocnema kinseyi]|uniref:myogenesis-regulating glycosidase n=1 Tax=Belonocnema kinseyi TaxID=2817044 RepID=UPI00143CFAF0|nr:myogenesis-regulating glycosidase [Belonocnema kinseyi]